MTSVREIDEEIDRDECDEDPGDQLAHDPTAPTASTAVGCLFAAIGVLIGFKSLGDNSFLTHLQTGELFLADGFFDTDPYTFTGDPAAPVVVQSWFASLIYAVLNRLGGGVAIQIFRALLTAVLASLVWRLSSTAGFTTKPNMILARVAAVAPAVFLGLIMWSERPLLFGLAGIAAALYVANNDVSPKPLALVGIIWIWTHGSFPLGIALLAALAIGTRLDGRKPVREVTALVWLTSGVLVGGVVNPYGPKLLLFPLELLQRGEVLGHIAEWKPLDPSSFLAQLFLVGAVLMLASLVRARTFRSALTGLVFLGLAVMSVRNMSVAAIVFVPIIAQGFHGVGSTLDTRRSEWTQKMVVLTSVAALFIAVASVFTQPIWSLDRYPIEALDWMETEEILDTDDPVRFAHPDYAGNFIELRYAAEVPVFIDDRYEFHSIDVVDDYLSLFFAKDDWQDGLDTHNVDIVLWNEGSDLAEVLEESAEWTTTYEDDDWIISCRNNACAGS